MRVVPWFLFVLRVFKEFFGFFVELREVGLELGDPCAGFALDGFADCQTELLDRFQDFFDLIRIRFFTGERGYEVLPFEAEFDAGGFDAHGRADIAHPVSGEA